MFNKIESKVFELEKKTSVQRSKLKYAWIRAAMLDRIETKNGWIEIVMFGIWKNNMYGSRAKFDKIKSKSARNRTIKNDNLKWKRIEFNSDWIN